MSMQKFADLINSLQSPYDLMTSTVYAGGLEGRNRNLQQWQPPLVIVPGLRTFPALTGMWFLSGMVRHRYVLLPVSKDRVGLFFSVAKLMPTMCGGTRRLIYQVPEAGTISRREVSTLMRRKLCHSMRKVVSKGEYAKPEDYEVFRQETDYQMVMTYGILHAAVYCVDNESREYATKAIDTALVQLGKAMKAYPQKAFDPDMASNYCRHLHDGSSDSRHEWRNRIGKRVSPYGTFRTMTRDHAKIGWDVGVRNHLIEPSRHKYITLFNAHFKQDLEEQKSLRAWGGDCFDNDDHGNQSVLFQRTRWKDESVRIRMWRNLKKAVVTSHTSLSNCYATHLHIDGMSQYYLHGEEQPVVGKGTHEELWKAKARLIAKAFIAGEHGGSLHQRRALSSSFGYRALSTYGGQCTRHTGLIINALMESEAYLSKYWGIGLVYPSDVATNPNAGKHATDSILLYRKGGENGRRKRAA